jgi:hypothetical protein
MILVAELVHDPPCLPTGFFDSTVYSADLQLSASSNETDTYMRNKRARTKHLLRTNTFP